MELSRERSLWRSFGVVAGLAAVGFFAHCEYLYSYQADMGHGPLRSGTAGAFCLLSAIAGFAAARIMGALMGRREGIRGIAWKVFGNVAIPLGVVTIGVERYRTMNVHPISSNMKAVYIAGAFAIIAGIVSLAAERCVRQVQAAKTIARAAGA